MFRDSEFKHPNFVCDLPLQTLALLLSLLLGIHETMCANLSREIVLQVRLCVFWGWSVSLEKKLAATQKYSSPAMFFCGLLRTLVLLAGISPKVWKLAALLVVKLLGLGRNMGERAGRCEHHSGDATLQPPRLEPIALQCTSR